MPRKVETILYESFANAVDMLVKGIKKDLGVESEVLLFFENIQLTVNIPKVPSNITSQVIKALGHKVSKNGFTMKVKAADPIESVKKIALKYDELKRAVTEVMGDPKLQSLPHGK